MTGWKREAEKRGRNDQQLHKGDSQSRLQETRAGPKRAVSLEQRSPANIRSRPNKYKYMSELP